MSSELFEGERNWLTDKLETQGNDGESQKERSGEGVGNGSCEEGNE